MSSELRDKLRRLGVHKGAAAIQSPAAGARQGRGKGIESLVDGRLVETPYGSVFIHEETYATDHPHGGHALGDLLGLSPAVAARIGNDQSLAQVDLGRVVFLDTETTGLSGGTGTLAFLVGVGAFDAGRSAFVVEQFFLRTPAEEPAMLHALAERLDAFDGVVSFNGRSFDVPLLQSRFTLARMRPRILRAPHLDLLMPARRMWRGRLPSCALGSLEQHVLDVRREQADVPGFLIPEMYLNYIRWGDASEMPRVLYHNAIDILSMVTLSTRLMRLFAPLAAGDLTGPDWLALGKWHADGGRGGEAEAALRTCLATQPDAATYAAALQRLGQLLKRADRRDEATRVWEALSGSVSWPGVEACVELAKHYEWRAPNIDRAIAWTGEAVRLTGDLPAGVERDQRAADLARRLQRLQRKR